MTSRSRRVTLILATIVFFVTSIVLLRVAQGWHISNGRLVQYAGLYVESQPRGTVLLDDQVMGTTPFRSSLQPPGRYLLTIKRPGFTTWSTHIVLRAGSALSIGEVPLLPEVQPEEVTELGPAETVLAEEFGSGLWIRSFDDQRRPTLRSIHRSSFLNSLTIPFSPSGITTSSDGQRAYLHDDRRAIILSGTGDWWEVPFVQQPTWAGSEPAVMLGLLDNQLVRIDSFSKSIEALDYASSLDVVASTVWYTTVVDDITRLRRVGVNGSFQPRTILEQKGVWNLIRNRSSSILLRQVETNQTLVVQGNAALGYRPTPIGRVISLLNDSPTTPFIWSDGLDILFQDGLQARLVDRVPETTFWAGWYQSKKALGIYAGHNLRMYARIGSSGFQFLINTPVPSKAIFLSVSQAGDGFWYLDDQTVYLWSWRL